MRQPFEDLIGTELDRLYRAAVFLTAGQADEAEQLLRAAVVDAYREYNMGRTELERPDVWLDGHLARALLQPESLRDDLWWRSTAPPTGASTESSVPLANHQLEDLAWAAGDLPSRQRITFWLGVLERRRYGTISEILDVPRDRVAEWIREGYRVMGDRLARTPDHRDQGIR